MHGLHQEKGPSFKTIVEESFRYQTAKKLILQRIATDFAWVEEKSRNFKHCRDVSDFCDNFKFEEFEREHSDLESIKEKFEQCNKYDISINKYIKTAETIGLLHASGRKLKDRLQKTVQREQHNLRKYLGNLAEQSARDITANLSNIKQTLGKQTSNLNQYVEYVNKVNQGNEQYAKMEEQKKELESMKGVLGRYREKSDSGMGMGNNTIQLLQSKIELITTELNSVREIIDQAKVKVTEGKENNTEQLSSQIVAE